MQYPEYAFTAAAYLREAIPLIVKHGSENLRSFTFWYTYIAKSNVKLNTELDIILGEHNTCPARQSTDLFFRYIIANQVDLDDRFKLNFAACASSSAH
jgi:hypothetical protein